MVKTFKQELDIEKNVLELVIYFTDNKIIKRTIIYTINIFNYRLTLFFIDRMRRSLPYKTFHSGSSYSAANNSYNFCHRSKLFAVLNFPVNCLVWSLYGDLKYAFKFI